MKTETKQYLKIIGIESFMMVIAIIIAGISCKIQFLGKGCIGHYSGYIFSGDVYQYNLLTYMMWIAFYFGLFVFLYKRIMKKSVLQLAAYSISLKILAWIICVFWALVMFVAQVMVVFLELGLTDIMEPEFMIWISVIGWPMVTALLIGMDIILICGGEQKNGRNI